VRVLSVTRTVMNADLDLGDVINNFLDR
jgi:hypothetical protein